MASNNNIQQATRPRTTQHKTSYLQIECNNNNKQEQNQQQQQQENHFNNNRRKFVRKVPPRVPASNRHNIYINTKTNFNAQLKRCEELLKGTDLKEIYLHCLGFAITTGLNLTLQLIKRNSDILDYALNTSTIHLTDEYHPLCDANDISIQRRNNSATHIKIFKKNTLQLNRNTSRSQTTDKTTSDSNKQQFNSFANVQQQQQQRKPYSRKQQQHQIRK